MTHATEVTQADIDAARKIAGLPADKSAIPFDPVVQAFARHASQARADERARVIREAAIPREIAEVVLEIGRAEWGQTPEHDADGHAAHVRESVLKTQEHFNFDCPTNMHGLYVEGTGTVICHTGVSPNSPTIARALTGVWNQLYDQCAAILALESKP